ncbi:DUF5018 domain-containing protein, partial [Aquiflexum lacus]|uniref:DUF5018 domain-containing protein n=1 Tax=Aquiflexum lacus TaxID=2483805 RepID=UPI0018963730
MGFNYNLLSKGIRIMLFFSLFGGSVFSSPKPNTPHSNFTVYSEFKIPDKSKEKSEPTFEQSQFLRFVGPCGNISLLDCDQIEKSLPVNLDFTSIGDGLSESGFTMYLEQSKFMTPYSELTSYDPTRILRNSDGLSITSTRGIFFSQQSDQGIPNSLNTNTQVNALGVGIKTPERKFSVSSRLVNPDFSVSTGNSAQQAGIWYGLDEDHYVKLVVVKNSTGNDRRIQLQVENMDNTTQATAFLEINTGNIGSTTGEITLRLEFDPIANTVQGFYKLGSGEEILVTSAATEPNIRPVPASYFLGTSFSPENPSELLSFAGIFTSHRNSTGNPISVLFKDFSIEAEEIVLPDEIVAPYRINVGGNDYTKDGDLFLAENTIYLSETTPTTVSLTPITNPYLVPGGHEDLYFPRRFGSDFGYNFPIENGTYSVRIHMVENFQTTAGARVFDIIMEDNVAQDNLDLFAVYGKGALGITQNNVTVSDGELNIQFLASANNALIQAIEILPLTQSLEKEILSFEFAEQTGPAIIDFISKTVSIEVAEGTDPNGLIPSITISNLASISPLSNVAQDFSNPVQYTVTAEDGSTAIWTVSVSIATTDFSFIDDFDTYGTGNLNIIAPTQWLWENGAGVQIPVLDQGISPNTTHSLDFSLGGHTHDLIPLTSNPVSLTPNKPFYFSTYFNVEALGAGAGDIIRTAIRIDDGDPDIQWVRLQMAKAGNDLIARIGLGDAASDNGNVGVDYGKTIQFVVKGEWDGSGNINYLWTIEPKLDESQNTWVSAGFHPVVGTPQIGRLFISSVNTNNGKVGPVRLSTDYSEVVTEDLTSPVPSSKKSILDFLIVGQIGSTLIDNEANTVQITVPFGTDLTEISPLFSVSESAIASPASGEAQDLSSPVVYTVTAEDGTIQEWTVSVIVEAGFEVKVNFQNNPSFTVPPVGYLPDYGKQFGFSSVT